MAHAVYESLAFGIRHILSVMDGHGVSPGLVHASGGLSRNMTLTQIKSNILGLPISTAIPYELSSLGVGAIALSAVSGQSQTGPLLRWSDPILPEKGVQELYSQAFSAYLQYVTALLPTFDRTGTLE